MFRIPKMICSLTNFPSGFSSLSFHEDDPKSMMASTTHLNGPHLFDQNYLPPNEISFRLQVSLPSTRRPPCRSRPPTTHPRGTVPIHFARPLAPHLNTALPSAGGSKVSWCGYSGSDQSWVKGPTQARFRQLVVLALSANNCVVLQ